ncbi:hypothetical protein [Paenibacillus rhizophilus]|uniref:Uncharacterized protein n=1 Tax=Paenibacillus rhizophilus TaxID=1850366 RepID=A0A3N9P2S8_9BACL|nr:hypothetical protein [Paenibacillus rhizophilus]RQW09384.1 hypothetical protein EH198_19650 [Paenibacillus rhizophilus]
MARWISKIGMTETVWQDESTGAEAGWRDGQQDRHGGLAGWRQASSGRCSYFVRPAHTLV